MGRLLLQLSLNSLIFINATAYLFESNKNDIPTEYRLPDYVIPKHYNIDLQLEPYFEVEGTSFNFSGSCEVYVRIIRPTWYISLHAQKPQIEIQETYIINREISYTYLATNITYNNETHILIFHYGTQLSNGRYLLHMRFSGLSNNDGIFFRTTYVNDIGDKMWFVSIQFRGIGARQLFPCWDEPAFKATFNISVKHPINYLALSSIPTQEKKTVDKNMTWTHFKTTRLMSTYLITLILHDERLLWFHSKEALNKTLSLPGTMFARDFIDVVTKYLRNKWGYFKNLSDVHHLIIPTDHQHNGLGVIIYKISNVFYDEMLDPVSHKMKAACLIAYEIARQWFNNLISPSWWSDYWLHEGIARLLGMAIVNKTFPDSSMLNLFAVQSKRESLYLDDFISGIMNPLISGVINSSEIDSLFSFSYYIKAPVILRMLQQHLSDKVFDRGIAVFLKKHKFSSATIHYFWSAMQVAQNIIGTPNTDRFNIGEMMDTWTKQKHYPVLKITRTAFGCEYLVISVENVHNLTKYDWFIPIHINTISFTSVQTLAFYHYWKTQLNITAHKLIKMVSPVPTLPNCINHTLILANYRKGYYRINYELENWWTIANYLNSAKYMNIHVLDRAQIIDDAFYFLSMSQLKFLTFFKLINYLSQEIDFAAWYPMIKALEHMSSFFPITGRSVYYIKNAILALLNRALKHIGYEERSEGNYSINCLRQEIAKWACILQDHECLQSAKYKLEQHLMHNETLLPWWKEWTYCYGISTEKNLTGIWNTVVEKWMSDSDNRIFEFLTCINHTNAIKEYLEDKNLGTTISSKNMSSKFGNIDRVNRFLFIVVKHARNNEILEYILNNFAELKPSEVNMIAALVIIINHVYSEVQLKMIRECVENKIIKMDIDQIYKSTSIKNLFDRYEFDEVRESMRNVVNRRISFINRKIGKRLNEITLLQSHIKKILK